ncbi:hypothetical protein [Pararhodobacter sp. CCB-MM2]|uniref:hypothetical protein n=1 Tax=Pararhodobacter sp. CCB-MM2 TaxID=1786003 RepID=UPI0008353F73|nr:hypothetical protein [Pararhodobacter sp. CCB-MM2]
MTRFLPAAAAAILALAPLTAQAENDPEKTHAVIGMLRAYGCTLNAAQVERFMPDMGTTPEEYSAILADAVARGFARGDASVPGDVTLLPNFCTLTHAESGDALLVEVMRYNDCRLRTSEIPVLLVPLGFRPDSVRAAAGAGIGDGRIIRESDQELSLSEAACHPEM